MWRKEISSCQVVKFDTETLWNDFSLRFGPSNGWLSISDATVQTKFRELSIFKEYLYVGQLSPPYDCNDLSRTTSSKTCIFTRELYLMANHSSLLMELSVDSVIDAAEGGFNSLLYDLSEALCFFAIKRISIDSFQDRLRKIRIHVILMELLKLKGHTHEALKHNMLAIAYCDAVSGQDAKYLRKSLMLRLRLLLTTTALPEVAEKAVVDRHSMVEEIARFEECLRSSGVSMTLEVGGRGYLQVL